MAAKHKPGETWRQLALEANRRKLLRQREPVIPDKVLKKLASLNLPNNPWVYSVVLDALLLRK